MYLEEQNKIESAENNEEKTETVAEPEKPVLEDKKPIDCKAANKKPYTEMVEEMRLQIFNDVKKAQRRSRISSFIMMFCLVVAVVFLFARNEKNAQLFLILGISFLVLAIFVLIGTSIINKRTNRIDTKGDYIIPACTAINRFVFDGEGFEKVTFDADEKIDLGDVYGDSVYTGVTDCVSRNVVHGTYHGRDFMIADLGLYMGPRGRQRRTTFIGKYIKTSNKLHFEGQYVLLSKGKTEMDIPVLPEGLNVVYENETFSVYGGMNSSYQEEIGTEFVSKIRNIDVGGVLLDIAIGLRAGECAIYLSFDDPVTTLPFYEKLKDSAIEDYKEILNKVMEALDLLSK